MSRTAVVLSAGLATGLFGLVLVILELSTSAPPAASGPSPAALESRLRDLEETLDLRLDEIERNLHTLRLDAAASSGRDGDEDRPEEAFGDDMATGEDGSESPDIASVLARMDILDRRLHALEEDPIQRGYTYLDSESAELRRQGVFALESIAANDPQARYAIRQMLEDPDAGVRLATLDTLADLGDKDSIPGMIPLLLDGESRVRAEAISSLSRLGAVEAGPDIATMLADGEARVRERAADALGRMKYPEAASGLLGALADPSDEVRGEAIASLGELGAREAIPALRRMYEEEAGRHRIRLVRSLQQLGDDGPLRKEVTQLSQTALAGENEDARRQAIRTLSWLAREQSKEIFRRALEDPSRSVRREAERALGNQRRR